VVVEVTRHPNLKVFKTVLILYGSSFKDSSSSVRRRPLFDGQLRRQTMTTLLAGRVAISSQRTLADSDSPLFDAHRRDCRREHVGKLAG
jgi:hypothetical protein